MSFNVSTIGSWCNENGQDLMSKKVLEMNTLKAGITIMPNVKYKEQIKFLETDALFQCADCTFLTSGTTSITDKDLTVDSLKINEMLCPADLEKTSLQLSSRPGWNTSIPFEAQYADYKASKIQEALETRIWNATSGGTCTTSGWIEMIAADGDVVNGGTISGSSASDFIANLFAGLNSIAAAVSNDANLTLFIDPVKYNVLTQKLILANLFPIAPQVGNLTADQYTSYMIPGTNVRIMPVNGLRNTGKAYLTPSWNLIFGTDMLGEERMLDIFYSRDNDAVRVIAHVKAGVSYYFGSYIVKYVIS